MTAEEWSKLEIGTVVKAKFELYDDEYEGYWLIIESKSGFDTHDLLMLAGTDNEYTIGDIIYTVVTNTYFVRSMEVYVS